METKLERIAEISATTKKPEFTALYHHISYVDEHQTVADFNLINNSSNLNWSFKSQVTKFIKRFLKDPYRSEDTEWIRNLVLLTS